MSVDKMAHEIKPGDTLAWTDATPEFVERVVVFGTGVVRVYPVGRRSRPYNFAYRELVAVEEVRW